MKMKGVVARKTFVCLNGAKGVSDIGLYEETYKDGKGKKHKERHTFFIVDFGGNSFVRFERDRWRLPLNKYRDINDPHTVVVYTDKTLAVARQEVIKEMLK